MKEDGTLPDIDVDDNDLTEHWEPFLEILTISNGI